MHLRMAGRIAVLVTAALATVSCAQPAQPPIPTISVTQSPESTPAASDSGSGLESDPGAGSGPDAGSDAGSAGSDDARFVEQALERHERTVEYTEMLLDKAGVDPQVVEVAEQILATSTPHRTELAEWDASHADPTSDPLVPIADDGEIGDDDVAALEQADAESASRLYVEQMIDQHESMLAMAESEIESGGDTDVIAMANDIAATHAVELAAMETIAQEL